MSEKIKVAIMGYGNLGKGVELAIAKAQDMEIKCIFTRRSPETLKPVTKGISVYKAEDALKYKDEIDVLILCGGSATDLPVQGPEFAEAFNTVDSFDTHAKIPEYFEKVNTAAKKSGKTGIISIGWDPGMFSIQRMLFEAILPEGNNYTFWGKGVSQGHSDAIRRVDGVKDAKQYTV
ncbi:MAG: diaminopimelate dehydrogenase, partial [Clostridia bacterium]|nr:diaminopimelate dehydrogenase [Clostridia bacterium]